VELVPLPAPYPLVRQIGAHHLDSSFAAIPFQQILLAFGLAVAIALIQPLIDRFRSFLVGLLSHGAKPVLRLVRARRKRGLLAIKNTRWNDAAVTLNIVRTYALLLVLAGVIGFYAVMFLVGPLRGVEHLPIPVQLLILSPIYVFEVLWLLQREYMLVVVRYRGKLRLRPRRHTPRNRCQS
jgi:hypothetical protein